MSRSSLQLFFTTCGVVVLFNDIALRLGLRYGTRKHLRVPITLNAAAVKCCQEGKDGIDRILVAFVLCACLADVLSILMLEPCNHGIDLVLRLLELVYLALERLKLGPWKRYEIKVTSRSIQACLTKIPPVIVVTVLLSITSSSGLLLGDRSLGPGFSYQPQQLGSSALEVWVLVFAGGS